MCSTFLSGRAMDYIESVNYLGVHAKSGMRFSCSFTSVKLAFYRAFNAVYSKRKAANSELISVYLLKTVCIPVHMYSLEATGTTGSVAKMLDFLINNAVQKFLQMI